MYHMNECARACDMFVVCCIACCYYLCHLARAFFILSSVPNYLCNDNDENDGDEVSGRGKTQRVHEYHRKDIKNKTHFKTKD